MAVLVDQYSDVLRLRSNLSQHFYYPTKTNSNIPKSAILNTKCKICRGKCVKVARKSGRLFRTRFTNKKCFRCCHQRKQNVRAYANKSSNIYRIPLKSHSQRRMLEHRSSQTIVVNPYVVSRLKQLGTTVVCEGTSATADNDLYRSITANNGKKIDQSVIQSSSDEFLISFNTLLQEVFPVDLSEQKDVVVDDFSTIFDRIPKSLSITLA